MLDAHVNAPTTDGCCSIFYDAAARFDSYWIMSPPSVLVAAATGVHDWLVAGCKGDDSKDAADEVSNVRRTVVRLYMHK
jgi:hypothetical protein